MFKRILILLVVLMVLSIPLATKADFKCIGGPNCAAATSQTDCEAIVGCAWAESSASQTSPEPVKLTNPLSTDSPNVLIGKIVNSILGLVGSLALLMFVFGGLTWMTSSGNQEKVKRGRDIIVWSAIGLVIIFASYGLIRFLLINIKS